MPQTLARIQGPPDRLASVVATAALHGGGEDAHEEMFVRVTPAFVDTPANAPEASQVSYCTAMASRFDAIELAVEPPVYALFDVAEVLAWLDWLATGADRLTLALEGESTTGITDSLVIRTTHEAVTIPCATDWRPADLSLAIPDRFADAQFLDEAGEPVPTRAEVDVAALERIVEASRLATGGEEYHLRFTDDGLRFQAGSHPGNGEGAHATGQVDVPVTGPAVQASYGPGFARVVTSLSGTVSLQTGPGQPLAVCKERDGFTLRFVVHRQ